MSQPTIRLRRLGGCAAVLITLAAASTLDAAVAQPTEGQAMIDAVAACASIAAAAPRLACYDRAVGRPQEAAVSASGAPVDEGSSGSLSAVDPDVTLATRGAAQDPRESEPRSAEAAFGAEDLPKTFEARKREAGPDNIVAGIVDIATTGYGKYLIVLDNDQVWRQLQADTSRLRTPRDLGDIQATVTRRSLGGYSLSLSTGNRSIRVERVK
ncbi:MAG: hypothetical protein GC152_02555 [Alphaproteobacteria bacterium]|nr:hypothetical protein [Alphaproteobacteria bacterium]